MIYYTLPGDTFSSLVGKRLAEISAPTIDAAAEWLAYRNPHLLRSNLPSGTAYSVIPWQRGGIIYA